ncbi:hypothetical protein SGUI_0761 [Serinicoccus hydrothermalis]|uniref:Mycothiol-dependent maleylpyruvate isomerase metal-binding domain-containing protein n=1 Tax=Serinicoccus hydrothermalis TaxID=1758689 RepID=A0A1B1N9Q0_9MICO|nr:TIGR03086 family metal-binding protein [Serinicoccus hydrothermalis]ANS78157.1 hypothetical protein SGUI_0761 [Serinicoccus hydrothermalis]
MATAPITVGPAPAIDTAFVTACDLFERTLAAAPRSRWADPTPCAAWTVRDLVGHVVQTLVKIPALVRDEPFTREDEPVTGDLVSALAAVAGPAREAMSEVDPTRTADTPWGRGTLAQALAFPVSDLAVHSWDLAHATGQRLQLPGELLAHVVAMCDGVPEEVLRGAAGFAAPVPVPADADDTTTLIAWLGRDPGS